MSSLVPELKLYQIINALIDEVDADFNRHSDPEKTFLFYLFGEGVNDEDNKNVLGKYKYFDQAKSLFVGRDKEHPRKVNVRMMFDAAQASVPTIHITMPQEQSDHNTLSVGESGNADNALVYNNSESTLTPLYRRRFQTMYQIVCTSENAQEVWLMYHVLRAALISSLDLIDLMGLKNPKLSGQDVRAPKEDGVPNHIYMRGLGLSCFYEINVPRYFDNKVIADIINVGKLANE